MYLNYVNETLKKSIILTFYKIKNSLNEIENLV